MACIALDDDRKVWLTRADLLESGWHAGSSVKRNEFERFVQLHQYPRALDQAVSMLARRPCSKGEIRQNLKRHHYNEDVTDLVICKLEKENLLSDHDFSELWVQHRSKKYGSRRIRQELKYKGVSEDTADEALAQLNDEELLENATAIAMKAWSKTRPGDDLSKLRQKIIFSLVRKGFDWDMAKQACDSARKSLSSETR